MKIGEREIGGRGEAGAGDVYIIAELGVNHDGSVERALEMTRAAAAAGADAVKLQLFEADLLMSRAAKLAAYQKAAGERDPIEMLRRLEMPVSAMARVVSLAHELGVHAIVTVFSVELVAEAERLPWDAYKTASPDLVNLPLLKALEATGRPLILSTGAATLEEVEQALGWLRGTQERLAVLQCVSSYPTPLEQAALAGIGALRAVFDGPVGYSDHTAGVEAGALAVARGAVVLEKHFTYDKRAAGPDHAASLEAAEFAEYVRRAREAARISPNKPAAERRATQREQKVVLEIERDVRAVSRQSVTSTRPLEPGRVLQRSDLTIKRPGTGLPPSALDDLIGRRLSRAVETDMPLMFGDVEGL